MFRWRWTSLRIMKTLLSSRQIGSSSQRAQMTRSNNQSIFMAWSRVTSRLRVMQRRPALLTIQIYSSASSLRIPRQLSSSRLLLDGFTSLLGPFPSTLKSGTTFNGNPWSVWILTSLPWTCWVTRSTRLSTRHFIGSSTSKMNISKGSPKDETLLNLMMLCFQFTLQSSPPWPSFNVSFMR